MTINIATVRGALESYGVNPLGLLTTGMESNNYSVTNSTTFFLKVLGENNTVDQFERELALARIFPMAPQPLIDHIIYVDGTPAVAWKYVNGFPVDPERLNYNEGEQIVDQLFNLYHLPTKNFPFNNDRWNVDKMWKRVRNVDETIPAYMMEAMTKLVIEATCLVDELSKQHLPKRVMVHGDPHTGNMLKIKNRIRLMDFESIKHTSPEYDLACIYQDLVQNHDNPDTFQHLLEYFNSRMKEEWKIGVNLNLLNTFIQIRNISTLTYRAQINDWWGADDSIQLCQHLLEGKKPKTFIEKI